MKCVLGQALSKPYTHISAFDPSNNKDGGGETEARSSTSPHPPEEQSHWGPPVITAE